jgi:hypothetical protein
MTEAQFFEGLVTLLIQCDPSRLTQHHEFVYGTLMDWLYPHMGAENN